MEEPDETSRRSYEAERREHEHEKDYIESLQKGGQVSASRAVQSW